MFIFLKLLYSQSNETGILEVLKIKFFSLLPNNGLQASGFPILRGAWGAFPHPTIFLKTSHQNQCPQCGATHLKMKPPIWKTTPPHWTAKPSSKKWFLGKNFKKSETVINTCASIIKQHWKKTQETPQECDFLTCSIQNLVRKVKLLENIIFLE